MPEENLSKYLRHIWIIQLKMRRAFWGLMIGPNNWSAREKVPKIPPTDNVNRRYSRINRIIKKRLNIKRRSSSKNVNPAAVPVETEMCPTMQKKSSLKISLDCSFNECYGPLINTYCIVSFLLTT